MASSYWTRPCYDTSDIPLETYRGQCHCGRFQYEFIHPSLTRTDVEVVSCNCTLCVQRGYLLVYVEKCNLKFTRGNVADLSVYKFATCGVSHRFCPTCGCGLMGEGSIAIAVNLRNTLGLDLSRLRLKPWNGMDKGRPPAHELPGIAMLRGRRPPSRDKGVSLPVQ